MKTLYEEITGIELHTEVNGLMNLNECASFRNRIQQFMKDDKNAKYTLEPFYEVYFDSPELSDDDQQQAEQFFVTVSGKKDQPNIYLKKKCQVNGYFYENDTKLTKNQYRKLLQGKYEWMKKTGILLIQEFYQKIQIFKYQVEAIKRGVRETFDLQQGKLKIFLDYCCRTLFYSGTGQLIPISNQREEEIARVQIQYSEASQYAVSNNYLL